MVALCVCLRVVVLLRVFQPPAGCPRQGNKETRPIEVHSGPEYAKIDGQTYIRFTVYA